MPLTTATSASFDMARYMEDVGAAARSSSRLLACATTAQKNTCLRSLGEALLRYKNEIIAANEMDCAGAQASGYDSGLLDRLQLSPQRIEALGAGILEMIELPDPVGVIEHLAPQPSGIRVGRMRVPLGVIAMIYEARPGVTIDAAALCIKSGNALILRGGSEAIHTNRALAGYIQTSLEEAALPGQSVQLVATTDRAAVGHLLAMKRWVDVIIPRGGKTLIQRVDEEAQVPVISHFDGICHVYVEASADTNSAVDVCVNAKTQRLSTCNTAETLLVDQAIAAYFLPEIARRLQQAGVSLRGCSQTRAILPNIDAATEEDWRTEYLAAILSVRVVKDLDEAIAHIAEYGSGHTDTICSSDYHTIERFVREVDSSSVMVNASTRFADGFEYGLGAEIGISTNRLHVRGPVGLEGLTCQKYVVYGDGHIRQ